MITAIEMISVNRKAMELVEDFMVRAEEFGIQVERTDSGSTIIDAGIGCRGGLLAGSVITEICLGGYGSTMLSSVTYGGISLESIYVATDHPAIALLGSQFAGWRVKGEGFFAMGSGPARALALKPKKLYQKISYRDESDVAVIVLETSEKPPESAVELIASSCQVEARDLYLILTPTNSVAGCTQISGRIAETGIHKLSEEGLDPKCVISASGTAPIAPSHPKAVKAMGRTNDMLLYGGVSYYRVRFENEESKLEEIVKKASSSASRDYGKPFYEIFKAADYDFYKIDPGLFAPAVVVVNNVETGRTYSSGNVNVEILQRSVSTI